jgi:hypothetical protein
LRILPTSTHSAVSAFDLAWKYGMKRQVPWSMGKDLDMYMPAARGARLFSHAVA